MSDRLNKKSIFLSKPLEELELLPDFCLENNLELRAHSFLSFEAVPFSFNFEFDVVFFASPRAAKFFLDKVQLTNKWIAVAGESTQKFVEKLGFQVQFCPTNSGSVSESSIEFANWVGNKKVLFPTSDRSHKSYTKQLSKNQFETIITYKTQISTQNIGINDVYVFTSPSNVAGFLKNNAFPSQAKIVAWGETTYNELSRSIDKNQLVMLEQSSEEAFCNFYKSQLEEA